MTTIDRIKSICTAKGIAIAKLERDLGFSNGVISKSDTIKDTRLLEIAEYLDVPASLLLGEQPEHGHYIDPEVIALSHEMATRPELAVLLSGAKTLNKDDLDFINQTIEHMKKKY